VKTFHPGDMVKSIWSTLAAPMWDDWSTAGKSSTSSIVGRFDVGQLGIVLSVLPKHTTEILIMTSLGELGWMSHLDVEIA